MDCKGVENIRYASVVVTDSVDVEIDAEGRIRLGESTELRAIATDPNAKFVWRNEEEVFCDGCPEVTVSPEETTEYEVEAITRDGCNDRAELTIVVEDQCAFGQLEIPNLMTPNADGANDEFEIRYEGLKEVSSLKIFNRWGEIIYETDDIDAFWDGTHRGKPVNPGVFVYYIEGRCLDDEPFVEQGNVTVIR